MNLTNETPKYASMHEVVMKKSELIDKLYENKAKHDVVLATAISGYWETAQSILDKKKENLYQQVDDFKSDCDREFDRISEKIKSQKDLPNSLTIKLVSINPTIGLVFPEDHSKDYDRAISMMQSSIYDTVSLGADEYDAYVLNNWEWKKNFLLSNSAYITNYTNKYGGFAGPAGKQGATGPVGSGYSPAYQKGASELKSLNSF